MSVSQVALRAAEHIHGHMGWLSVAALLHPAILLRNPKRRAGLAVLLTTAFVTATGLLGGWIYPHYREQLKQQIFIHTPVFGWLFERKEHLAVGAIGFAWVGCVTHLSARAFEDDALEQRVSMMAFRAYVIAFVLCLAVASIGVIAATNSTF